MGVQVWRMEGPLDGELVRHDPLLKMCHEPFLGDVSCVGVLSSTILLKARSQGGSGGHDPPIKLTVACAAGHFAPARSATKRKVVQTLPQF